MCRLKTCLVRNVRIESRQHDDIEPSFSFKSEADFVAPTYDAFVVVACPRYGELAANSSLCCMRLYSRSLWSLDPVGKHMLRVKRLVFLFLDYRMDGFQQHKAVRCMCGVMSAMW